MQLHPLTGHFTSTAETSRTERSQHFWICWSSFTCYWQVITFHGLQLPVACLDIAVTLLWVILHGKVERMKYLPCGLPSCSGRKQLPICGCNSAEREWEGNCRQFTVTFNVKLLQNFRNKAMLVHHSREELLKKGMTYYLRWNCKLVWHIPVWFWWQ